MLRLLIQLGFHGRSHKAKEAAITAWMDKQGGLGV